MRPKHWKRSFIYFLICVILETIAELIVIFSINSFCVRSGEITASVIIFAFLLTPIFVCDLVFMIGMLFLCTLGLDPLAAMYNFVMGILCFICFIVLMPILSMLCGNPAQIMMLIAGALVIASGISHLLNGIWCIQHMPVEEKQWPIKRDHPKPSSKPAVQQPKAMFNKSEGKQPNQHKLSNEPNKPSTANRPIKESDARKKSQLKAHFKARPFCKFQYCKACKFSIFQRRKKPNSSNMEEPCTSTKATRPTMDKYSGNKNRPKVAKTKRKKTTCCQTCCKKKKQKQKMKTQEQSIPKTLSRTPTEWECDYESDDSISSSPSKKSSSCKRRKRRASKTDALQTTSETSNDSISRAPSKKRSCCKPRKSRTRKAVTTQSSCESSDESASNNASKNKKNSCCKRRKKHNPKTITPPPSLGRSSVSVSGATSKKKERSCCKQRKSRIHKTNTLEATRNTSNDKTSRVSYKKRSCCKRSKARISKTATPQPSQESNSDSVCSTATTKPITTLLYTYSVDFCKRLRRQMSKFQLKAKQPPVECMQDEQRKRRKTSETIKQAAYNTRKRGGSDRRKCSCKRRRKASPIAPASASAPTHSLTARLNGNCRQALDKYYSRWCRSASVPPLRQSSSADRKRCCHRSRSRERKPKKCSQENRGPTPSSSLSHTSAALAKTIKQYRTSTKECRTAHARQRQLLNISCSSVLERFKGGGVPSPPPPKKRCCRSCSSTHSREYSRDRKSKEMCYRKATSSPVRPNISSTSNKSKYKRHRVTKKEHRATDIARRPATFNINCRSMWERFKAGGVAPSPPPKRQCCRSRSCQSKSKTAHNQKPSPSPSPAPSKSTNRRSNECLREKQKPSTSRTPSNMSIASKKSKGRRMSQKGRRAVEDARRPASFNINCRNIFERFKRNEPVPTPAPKRRCCRSRSHPRSRKGSRNRQAKNQENECSIQQQPTFGINCKDMLRKLRWQSAPPPETTAKRRCCRSRERKHNEARRHTKCSPSSTPPLWRASHSTKRKCR